MSTPGGRARSSTSLSASESTKNVDGSSTTFPLRSACRLSTVLEARLTVRVTTICSSTRAAGSARAAKRAFVQRLIAGLATDGSNSSPPSRP
jgi:hypothetical protein